MTQAARNTDDLVLIKAAQVWPFVDTISRRGADIAALAQRAGLPLDAVIEKQGYVGERSAWRFIGFAAQELGNEHLGHLVAVEHPVQSTGELGGMRMRMACSLGTLLECFVEDVTYENNGARYWLVSDGNTAVLRREVVFPDCIGRWQTEQYMVTVFLQIMSLCTGPSWKPTRLGLASRDAPVSVPDAWSDIQLTWGCTETEIEFDATLLSEPVPSAVEALNLTHHRTADAPVSALDIDYIVDRQIWAGGASLDQIALELGVSRSTLKRRLKTQGRSYSGILAERRHYWAKQLLAEPDIPISHIAKSLGYGHSSNFARSFKNHMGISPRDYRDGRKARP